MNRLKVTKGRWWSGCPFIRRECFLSIATPKRFGTSEGLDDWAGKPASLYVRHTPSHSFCKPGLIGSIRTFSKLQHGTALGSRFGCGTTSHRINSAKLFHSIENFSQNVTSFQSNEVFLLIANYWNPLPTSKAISSIALSIISCRPMRSQSLFIVLLPLAYWHIRCRGRKVTHWLFRFDSNWWFSIGWFGTNLTWLWHHVNRAIVDLMNCPI